MRRHRRPAARPSALVAAVMGIVVALAACTPTETPLDVAVGVYQGRTDMSDGRIAIRVENRGDETVRIVAAEMRVASFSAAMSRPAGRATTVPPGRIVDLRVPLVPPDCDADPSADGMVRLTYRTDAGQRREEVPLTGSMDPLTAVWRSGCLATRVAAIATIASAGLDWSPGVGGAALLLDVTPTGADGEVRLVEARGTTLLSPSRDGVAVTALPLDVTVAGTDAPAQARIPLVPTRCDPHAIAEDKVGTRIPLIVEVAGETGRLVLPASEPLRREMHAYVVDACGL